MDGGHPSDSTKNATLHTLDQEENNPQQSVDMSEGQGEHLAEPEQEEQGRKCEAPVRVFLLLCLLYAVVFMDRGSLATTAINGHEETEEEEGHGLRGDFSMSNFENGALSSVLTAGRVLGSLVVPYVSDTSPLSVIGMGMGMWTIAALGCGLSIDFYFFAACRFLMGIGQAAIFPLGTVVVDDIAPKKGSTTWTAVYLATPGIGAAAGFFYGPLVGNSLSWRHAFYFEAVLVAPLVFLCFVQKKFYLKTGSNPIEGVADASPEKPCGQDAKRLFSHVLFDLAVVGVCLYIGYLACLEYWTARAIEAMFSPDGVDMTVGTMVFVFGGIGSLLGGALVDCVFGASVPVAFSLPAVSCSTSAAIIIPTVLFVQSYPALLVALNATLLILFLPLAAVNGTSLWTLPLDLRLLGRGQLVLFTQLFGVIPAPALYGLVVDWMEKSASEGQSHRVAQALAAGLLVLSSAVLFCAWFISPRHPDYKVGNDDA